ncbi:MAG: sigma-70 family RNA polymerase sigma factor [Rhodopirellula sp.]|nr:sigma-70 family RNA polymerase sigma factor [Rhodopirellula sp.]
MSSTDDDGNLVRAARQGDFDAFEVLVSRYERRMFGLAFRILGRRHDAEEVVQQTFLSVVEHIKDFREESTFHTWLSRIATNHALALLRRNKVRATVPLSENRSGESYAELPHPEYIAQWQETPDDIVARRETRALLDEALGELDEKYRVVFVLRDIEGFSTNETAETLGITPGNVKVRLLRARLMLRERLTRVFGNDATRVISDHNHED